MPPEKHVFRAGDAPSGGELRQQGGKTVFRAGGAKAEKRGRKPAAPAASAAPRQEAPARQEASAQQEVPKRQEAPSRPVKLRRNAAAPAPAAPAGEKTGGTAPKAAPAASTGEKTGGAAPKAAPTAVPEAAPRPAPAAAPKAAASWSRRRRGSRTPLIVLGSLLALLVVCLAGWALDVPARLEGLTLPGGSSSSATVKEGQDWPAMVGDRMVSEKPEKVVSLSPMITEALLSLPGHEALCAVTEYCDARSTGLATVGTPLLPRTEDIIALAPDYVLCQTPLAGPVQTELEEAGVEVIQMDTPADLAALREFYGQLGALLGGNETGRALGYGVIDRLESTLAAYDAALPEKASALLLPDLSGLAATADTAEWTLLGQVFRHPLPDAADWLAGAECLTDEDAGNDLDQIRAADPDVLLVADTVSPEDLSAALGDLRAVQNGAVVYVDIRLTETLSPRLVFAIADAAALAYPEFAPAS